MKLNLYATVTTFILAVNISFSSCSDDEVVNNNPIPDQPEQITELITQYNTNISAYQAMLANKVEIVDYTSDEKGHYKLQLSNQQIADVYAQTAEDKDIPLLGIDEEGYWIYQLEGASYLLTDLQGNPASALNKTGKAVFTPMIGIGEDGYWQVSYNGYQWKRLSNSPVPSLTGKTAKNFSLYRSATLNEETGIIVLKPRIGESSLTLPTHNSNTTATIICYSTSPMPDINMEK